MAQTYTLDEAAHKLNLSVDEFKRRMQTEWKHVRPFRDGTTVRYRANEIDELARTYGLGSSDELPLGEGSPLDVPASPFPSKGKKPASDSDLVLKLDDSDETFIVSPDQPKSSKKVKSGSDSDVKLEKGGKTKAKADDEESILTEEFDAVGDPTVSGKLSGKSGKLSSAKLKASDSGKIKSGDSAKAAKPPAEEDSSEFELSLDPDSDEFELSIEKDSSEEAALGDIPPESKKSGNSGINLNRPTDSGVSLEKKDDSDEIDFELTLDAPGTGMSSRKNVGASSGKKPGSGKKLKPDSDSEFELTLEEPSDLGLEIAASSDDKKADIFEATDFEIPALDDDSASEVVSLDDSDTDVESSDFDLALDEADAASEEESASQVVALSDEGSQRKSKKKKKRDDDDGDAVDLDDLETGGSASGALRGVRADDDDDDDEYEVSEAADDGTYASAASTEWGSLPAILMFPTLIVLFLGSMMSYELLHTMWGAQQGSQPTTPLVSWLAEQTGNKPGQ